jgi:hypothetical protein
MPPRRRDAQRSAGAQAANQNGHKTAQKDTKREDGSRKHERTKYRNQKQIDHFFFFGVSYFRVLVIRFWGFPFCAFLWPF